MKSNRFTLLICAGISALWGCGAADETDLYADSEVEVGPVNVMHPAAPAGSRTIEEYLANYIPEGLEPEKGTDPLEGVSIEPDGYYQETETPDAPAEGDYGTARQAFTSTQLQGWQTSATGSPGFLDLPTGSGSNPLGHCGIGTAGKSCLFPLGPNGLKNWKWRFDDSQCTIGGQHIFGSEIMKQGFIDAFNSLQNAQNSALPSYTFQKVTSGENITIFCDGFLTSRFDPNKQAGAFWYPFGNSVGPQTSVGIHAETSECNGVSGLFLAPGKAYTYAIGGIVWGPDVIFNTATPGGWAHSCQQAFPPHTQAQIDTWWRNLTARIAMHEILHHFGFAHFNNFPVLDDQMPCSSGNNFPAAPAVVIKAMQNLDVRTVTVPPLSPGVGAQINTIAGGISLQCGGPEGNNGP